MSNCQKRHYGAVVLSLDPGVQGIGFNRSVREQICNHHCPRRANTRGARLEACYAVHAEVAAINDFYRHNARLVVPHVLYLVAFDPVNGSFDESTLHLGERVSCSFCARVMSDAGIRYVVTPAYDDDIRVIPIEQLLDEAFRQAMPDEEVLVALV